jgi:hypothetical protein
MAVSLSGINQKYRRLLGALVLMVALLAVQPLVWRFARTRALVLQQTRSQGQQIANVNERNTAIKKILATQEDFLQQLRVVSPLTTDKTQVVEQIEHLGDQLGLVIDITLIQELQLKGSGVKEDKIVPVSMSVQTSGGARQLLNFLDRVEHTQELSVVPHWTLAPATTGEIGYTLSMDILFFLRRVTDGN